MAIDKNEVASFISKDKCWKSISKVFKSMGITNPHKLKAEYTELIDSEVQERLAEFKRKYYGLPESLEDWKSLVLGFPYGKHGGWDTEGIYDLYKKALSLEKKHIREDEHHLIHTDGTKMPSYEICERFYNLIIDEGVPGIARDCYFDRVYTEDLRKSIFLKYREYLYEHNKEPEEDWELDALPSLPEVDDALYYLNWH